MLVCCDIVNTFSMNIKTTDQNKGVEVTIIICVTGFTLALKHAMKYALELESSFSSGNIGRELALIIGHFNVQSCLPVTRGEDSNLLWKHTVTKQLSSLGVQNGISELT